MENTSKESFLKPLYFRESVVDKLTENIFKKHYISLQYTSRKVYFEHGQICIINNFYLSLNIVSSLQNDFFILTRLK